MGIGPKGDVMRALWVALFVSSVAAACSSSGEEPGCDPATCQQQCIAAGSWTGTCQGSLCICTGHPGGAGGGGGSAGAGGEAGGIPDAGTGGDLPDASCENPACGLTDCDPESCPAPCSTECVSSAEHCETDGQIHLCCIKSCNNGSETCDDESFIVPDETVDPDGIFYLVCAIDGGGIVFLSTVSGNCPNENIDRCRCYDDPPNEAIANAFESFPCTTEGERFAVDLTSHRGDRLYVGSTTYPDGVTGLNTRVCIQGN